MPNKKRRCPYCKEYNLIEDAKKVNNSYFCNLDHAVQYGIKNKLKGKKKIEKEFNQETARRKRALNNNDRGLRTKEAQKAFNAYIRARDNLDSCISCERVNAEVENTDGWKVGGAWDCGHYLTVGAHPELRFEELNAHKQCKSCNGGSDKYAKKTKLVATDYRINLIKKIGLDKVEWLEGPHEHKKYTCKDLKEIELKYKQKLKELLE